jgi:hypothetical protein
MHQIEALGRDLGGDMESLARQVIMWTSSMVLEQPRWLSPPEGSCERPVNIPSEG